MSVKDWSTTASSNTAIFAGISTDGTVMTVSQVDNAFREMAAQIASQLGKMGFEGADIASATTTNLANATGWSIDITGTTMITGLGTVDAGQVFILRFTGALTLTHNATSLILPGAANITTAAGDVFVMKSEGSGNWRCVAYQPSAGYPRLSAANTWTATQAFAAVTGTTGTFTSSMTAERFIAASGGNAIFGGDASTDDVLIRPDATSATNQMVLDGATGDVTIAGTLTVTGDVNTGDDFNAGTFSGTGASAGVFIGNDGVVNTSVAVTTSKTHHSFVNPNGGVGSIVTLNSATTYNTSSDGRLKKNLRDFDAGGFLDALEVWLFDWKAGGTGYGVIAQDAQKVFPDAITEGEDGYLVADYSKFVPLLIAEVKALRSRVAALEA